MGCPAVAASWSCRCRRLLRLRLRLRIQIRPCLRSGILPPIRQPPPEQSLRRIRLPCRRPCSEGPECIGGSRRHGPRRRDDAARCASWRPGSTLPGVPRTIATAVVPCWSGIREPRDGRHGGFGGEGSRKRPPGARPSLLPLRWVAEAWDPDDAKSERSPAASGCPGRRISAQAGSPGNLTRRWSKRRKSRSFVRMVEMPCSRQSATI